MKTTIGLKDKIIKEPSPSTEQLTKNKIQTVQTHLSSAKKKSLEEAWLVENREAIDEQNRHVEEFGIFGEEYKGF